MELSQVERWVLWNQLRILEKLYPDEADSFAVQKKAVECGYVLDYNSPIKVAPMTKGQCEEVQDTLNMFQAIDDSIRELGTNEFEEHSLRKFCGYDGNDKTEIRFMAYTHYLVGCMNRWRGLALENHGNINSHLPMGDTYRRMLLTWKGFGSQRFTMNLDQIEQVLNEQNA